MADLFGYTQTNNVRVDTSPQMINQRPDMRAANAFKDVIGIMQGTSNLFATYKESRDKDSMLGASKEKNAAYDWYVDAVSKTDDAYEKQQHLETYKTALDSIKQGYELSEENALVFDNSNKAFLGSQTMAVNKQVQDRQWKDIDTATYELLKGAVTAPTADVSKLMKQVEVAYTATGMDKKDVSDRVFNMYASMKISGLTNDNIGSITQIQQDIKDFAKVYDSKLINKDSYNKHLASLTKIQNQQTQHQKDTVTLFKASDNFKNFMYSPDEVGAVLQTNGAKDWQAQQLLYKQKYDVISNYNPLEQHPNMTAYPEEAKTRANFVVNQAVAGGDYMTALNVIDATGEVGVLKDWLNNGLKSTDPAKLIGAAEAFTKMMNVKNATVVEKLVTDEDALGVAYYLQHVMANNGKIDDVDVNFINNARLNTERYPLPKKFITEFKEDYQGNPDLVDNLKIANAMAKFGVPEDKIRKHFDDYYKATDADGVMNTAGMGNIGYSNEQIADALRPLRDDFNKGIFTDAKLFYNKNTNTIWVSNEGVPSLDTTLTKEDLQGILKAKEDEKIMLQENKNADNQVYDGDLGQDPANLSNAYYDLFEKEGSIFGTIIKGFKNMFHFGLHGADLPKNDGYNIKEDTRTIEEMKDAIVQQLNAQGKSNEVVEGIVANSPDKKTIEGLQQYAGVKADGKLGNDTANALTTQLEKDGAIYVYESSSQVPDSLYFKGEKASKQLAKELGRELTPVEKYIVEEEGYVKAFYKDTKGVVTYGVGQTQKFIYQKPEEVLKDKIKAAKRVFPGFDKHPEDVQLALVNTIYRGDAKSTYNWVQAVNKGDFMWAAMQLLDDDDYRKASKKGSGEAGIKKRFETNAKRLMAGALGFKYDEKNTRLDNQLNVLLEQMK